MSIAHLPLRNWLVALGGLASGVTAAFLIY